MYSYFIFNNMHHGFLKYVWKKIYLVILFLRIFIQHLIKKTISPQNKKTNKNKSTFLSSSFSGSVTLEAAIVLPVFLLAIISLYGFFILFNYHNMLQNSVNNTAKTIAKYSYVMDRIGEIENSGEIIEKLDMDNDILSNGINTGYAWSRILTPEIRNSTEKSNIVGGVAGLRVVSSRVDEENGNNRINVEYQMNFNIVGIRNYYIRLSNNCYFRTWIGETIVSDVNGNNQIVYITRSGRVYHLFQNCTYIEINLRKIKFSEIYLERNSKGNKYKKCNKCVNRSIGNNEYVYVTQKGLKYHIRKNCNGITRDAIPINILRVGNRRLCSRCRNTQYEGN